MRVLMRYISHATHGPAIYLEQVMHFQFGFGVNGTQTLWPHIQCNTLRRASDLADEVSKGKRARSS